MAQEVEEAAKVAKESPKLPKRKKRKPPASGVEILDILAKLVPTLKLFAASARKQVICNLYACLECSVSPIYQTIRLNDHRIKFEIDSGASDTFCCEATWQTLGKPILQPVSVQYQVAEGSPLPVVGQFQSTASIDGKSPDVTFPVIFTKVPNLNLLGRLAMMKFKSILTIHCLWLERLPRIQFLPK